MKNLSFYLELSAENPPVKLPKFDPDLDSIVSLVKYFCRYISEQEQCRFLISGFGDMSWPVDIESDLATFIPQLPYALIAIEQGKNFNLDLFEQGVERYMNFSPLIDGLWLVRCRCYTKWVSNPDEHAISTIELKAMIESFLSVFLGYMIQDLDQSNWRSMVDHWIKTGEESRAIA